MEEWRKPSGPFQELTAQWRDLSEKLPYVDAFLIHGSRAVGAETRTSDIDYAFFIKKKDDEVGLLRHLRKSLYLDSIPS